MRLKVPRVSANVLKDILETDQGKQNNNQESQTQAPSVQFQLNRNETSIQPAITLEGPEQKEETKIVGSLAVIVYFMTFIYVYASAAFKKKLRFDKFTLSHALQYSEKIGSTFFFVFMTSLLIGLIVTQNFIEKKEPLRLSVFSMTFVLLVCFLLLFWIPPRKKVILTHISIAVLMVLANLYSSFIIHILYSTTYEETQEIITLSALAYTLLAISIFLIIVFMTRLFTKHKAVKILIAIFEIFFIIIFGTIMAFFSSLGPLEKVGCDFQVCIE